MYIDVYEKILFDEYFYEIERKMILLIGGHVNETTKMEKENIDSDSGGGDICRKCCGKWNTGSGCGAEGSRTD